MEYTYLNEEEHNLYLEKLKDTPGFKPNWNKIKQLSKLDPSIFAKYYLGIIPYDYQDQVLNDPSKRINVCSSRQIGKTYVVAIKALHTAMFNPKIKVLVFSKSRMQAKKFLREMRQMMYTGMDLMNRKIDAEAAGEREPAMLFPEDFDKKKPNNTEEFTLTNGSTIFSLSPTDSSRGYTADLVIVDEAAFVPDEIFDMVIEPTVRHTDGTIILLSTPNGQKGFFYRYFDPEDNKDQHEYTRYWWNWEICPEESVRKMTELKKEELLPVEPLRFYQEYEAQFTSDADAFFQRAKVIYAARDSLEMELQDLDHDHICGIDYGEKRSKTVITLVRKDEARGDIILVYQRSFPGGYDNSKLPRYLEILETQFNIVQYVVDDCAGGLVVNSMLEQEGKNVFRFDFRKLKNDGYFRFRAALNKTYDDPQWRIRYPKIQPLVTEMIALQMAENKRGYYSISCPSGGYDDRIDSLMMACYPFISEDNRDFKASYLV